MDIAGKILEVFETQQVSASFKKREFVVEYSENPQYPEFIKFETIQDKVSLLDGLAAGMEVKVEFNLKGRKWTDPQGQTKYFNTLQAWRITPQSGEAAAAPPAADKEPDWLSEDKSDDGDLPF